MSTDRNDPTNPPLPPIPDELPPEQADRLTVNGVTLGERVAMANKLISNARAMGDPAFEQRVVEAMREYGIELYEDGVPVAPPKPAPKREWRFTGNKQ